ncbi:hypothetical protein [Corynebacterium lipophiloflavum]|uniref:hypothetical protein n=1 Tax=Corynebacterium lipophiloflavum TaxID=161889 RepID=UPI0012F9BF79|nr:hypothetical protein [Corynebacterium lipophiloflavum]
MDTHEFGERAERFANDTKSLVDSTLVGKTELETLPANVESLRATFNLSKSLVIATSGSDRLQLRCGYRLCVNTGGDDLAVETSTFKVGFNSKKKFVPIVRFEYDRNARSKPASHFQFHADSVALGLLLARAGRYETAEHQHKIHFPMGDHRFRVCLEDIVELLVTEFAARPKNNWQEHVDRGREKFHKLQIETVIRHNVPTAVRLLENLGYEVHGPQARSDLP